jgi:hypothetical protein
MRMRARSRLRGSLTLGKPCFGVRSESFTPFTRVPGAVQREAVYRPGTQVLARDELDHRA